MSQPPHNSATTLRAPQAPRAPTRTRRRLSERELALQGLLRQIDSDDPASYEPFQTPDELARLASADLALLLSERVMSPRDSVREPTLVLIYPTRHPPPASANVLG